MDNSEERVDRRSMMERAGGQPQGSFRSYLAAVRRHWRSTLVSWLSSAGLLTGLSLAGVRDWPLALILAVVLFGLMVAQFQAYRDAVARGEQVEARLEATEAQLAGVLSSVKYRLEFRQLGAPYFYNEPGGGVSFTTRFEFENRSDLAIEMQVERSVVVVEGRRMEGVPGFDPDMPRTIVLSPNGDITITVEKVPLASLTDVVSGHAALAVVYGVADSEIRYRLVQEVDFVLTIMPDGVRYRYDHHNTVGPTHTLVTA